MMVLVIDVFAAFFLLVSGTLVLGLTSLSRRGILTCSRDLTGDYDNLGRRLASTRLYDATSSRLVVCA